MPNRPFFSCVVGVVLASAIAVYGPDVGHGFQKDDFRWIAEARALTWPDVLRHDNGFYRPLVMATFVVVERLSPGSAAAHGIVNLGLALLCGAVIFALGRALALTHEAAVFAASTWLLSPHGINMAVLWISGRTALLLVLFGVLAAVAAVRRQPEVAGLLCLAALMSKEEAVLLPPVLIAWTWALSRGDRRLTLRTIVASAVALIVYFSLRAGTSAMTPATAPLSYAPVSDVATLARNVLEYADRVATFPLAVVVLAVAAAWTRPTVDGRLMPLALVWTLLGFGLTVFVPVRSSLYVCWPAVGTSLAAASVFDSLLRRSSTAARRRLAVLAIVMPLALVPLWRPRNVRWVRPADTSASILATLARVPAGSRVVLRDSGGPRVGYEAVFGNHLPEAVATFTSLRPTDVRVAR